MENASKALLMAAGVLVGILILSLMAVLFLAGSETFSGYEETKATEEVQRFNTNFAKYVGKKLTAHEVLTICNFAETNTVHKVNYGTGKTIEDIKADISNFNDTDDYTKLQKYKITITGYTDDGYVSTITIS